MTISGLSWGFTGISLSGRQVGSKGITERAKKDPDSLHLSPVKSKVSRPDEARAARHDLFGNDRLKSGPGMICLDTVNRSPEVVDQVQFTPLVFAKRADSVRGIDGAHMGQPAAVVAGEEQFFR